MPNAPLLIPGGDIPGPVAVTPASAAAAKSARTVTDAQGQEHAFLLTQLVSAPRIYRPPA